MVAAGGKPVRQDEQRSLLHVEHALAIDPRIGGKRDVDKQRRRQIVPPRAHRQMDAIERCAARPQIAPRADERIDIQVETVGLAAHHLVLRPQRLEAPPYMADMPENICIRRPALADLWHLARQHPAMVRQIDASAIIPLRVEPATVESRSIDGLRRQVQIELQFRGGLAAATADRELVEVVGGLAGILILAVIGGAVDVHHLRHREDFFEAVQDQGIALAAIIGLADGAALAGVRLIRLIARHRRVIIVSPGRSRLAYPAVRPQGTRQHRPISGRRLRRQFAGAGRGPPQPACRRRSGAKRQSPSIPSRVIDPKAEGEEQMRSDLAQSYGQDRLPRYTSYPTAPHFSPAIGEQDYRGWLKSISVQQPVSIYLHVPFCRSMCWYCGCHTSVTKRDEPIATYEAGLRTEAQLVAETIGPETADLARAFWRRHADDHVARDVR